MLPLLPVAPLNLMAAPQMVALDKNGNLYVANTNNCRVLVFEPHSPT